MSEYTQEDFEEDAKLLRSWCDEGGCAAEFDSLIAEVERRAAEKALTAAAEAIAPDSEIWIPDPNQPRGGLYWNAQEWLHERAKTYQRNEGENA